MAAFYVGGEVNGDKVPAHLVDGNKRISRVQSDGSEAEYVEETWTWPDGKAVQLFVLTTLEGKDKFDKAFGVASKYRFEMGWPAMRGGVVGG